MRSDTVVRARIDSDTKAKATEALHSMGLSVSEAIRLLMVRVAEERRMPFDVEVPNRKTLDAVRELERGGGQELRFRGRSVSRSQNLKCWFRSGRPGSSAMRGERRDEARDLDKLEALLTLLIHQERLPERYLDHPLRGNLGGYREAHIEPDWLVIYGVKEGELHLVRTGNHSDLFDE